MELRSDYYREIVSVRNERDELRERLRQAEELIRPEINLSLEIQLKPLKGRGSTLTAAESRTLALLYRTPGVVTHERLYAAMKLNDPEPKIVHITICRLKQKLINTGVKIENVFGSGYILPAESKAIIAKAIL